MQLKLWVASCATVLALAACGNGGLDDVVHQSGSITYEAQMDSTEGNEGLAGFVRFEPHVDGVRVLAEVEGLPANSSHGFHIHQYGDCGAPDGTSAGGHYNPQGMPHGGPDDERRHMGDMGNIETNEHGVGLIDYVDSHIQLDGPYSILGRGVIVHAAADDLESQPTGDAGARLLCGVIGVTED